MYTTAEWRNAQGLVQAIVRKRKRKRDLQAIRRTFDIELMMARSPYPNVSIHASFVVLVSLLDGAALLPVS